MTKKDRDMIAAMFRFLANTLLTSMVWHYGPRVTSHEHAYEQLSEEISKWQNTRGA